MSAFRRNRAGRGQGGPVGAARLSADATRAGRTGYRRMLLAAAVVAVLVGQLLSGVAYAVPRSPASGRGASATAPAAAGPGALDAPLDVAGAPSASVAVQADNLVITRTSADGSVTSDQWGTTAADLRSFTQKGNPGTEQSRTQLRPELSSTAARPLDAEHDRTLSLRLDAAGDSGLLQVASADASAEGQWAGQDTQNAEPSAGSTFVLSLPADEAGGTLSEPDGSPGFGSQMFLDHSYGTGARQQFTLVDAGGGYVNLVSLSDGLCVNNANASRALFSPVTEFPCAADDAASQWKPVAADTSGLGGFRGYAFYNKASGLVLSHDGNRIVQRAYNDAQPDASEVWQLTRMYQPGGVIPTWSMPVDRDPGIAAALAAGDLDRTVDDATHQYHDEAVVAQVNSDHKVEVRVIDYNANASHLLVTELTLPDPVGGDVYGAWHPGSVGVAIGNFNGSDVNEIAVTYQRANGSIAASFLSYSATDGAADGARHLSVLSSGQTIVAPTVDQRFGLTASPSLITGMVSTTGGDLDATGTASLAVAYGEADSSNAGVSQPLYAYVTAARFDTQSEVAGAATYQTPFDLPPPAADTGLLLNPPGGTTWTAHGPQVTAGLFKSDPATNYVLHRRELAVAWSTLWAHSGGSSTVRTWLTLLGATQDAKGIELSALSGPSPILESVNVDPITTPMLWRSPLAVVAGGFAGLGKGSDTPLWGLAIADGGITNSGSTWTDYLRVFSVLNDQLVQTYVESATVPIGTRRDYELTSYDRDGRTVRLGAPLKLALASVQQITAVGQQVPVHADWLDGSFLNVSRKPEEALTLGTASSSETSTSTTLRTSSAIGIGQGLDASVTLTTGVPKEEATGVTVTAGAKFGESWDKEDSAMSHTATTVDSSQSTTATDDDIVNAIYVPYELYRYPIIGSKATNSDGSPVSGCTDCVGYYEVIYPGNPIPLHGGGRSFSWYQPSYQNGNVLSYPVADSSGQVQVPSSDMGTYTYNNNGTTASGSGFLFNQGNTIGGTTSTADLKISHSTGTETEHTSTKTLKQSVDGSLAVSAVGGLPGIFQAKEEVKVSASFDHNSVEANTDVGGVTSTSSSSFSLELAQIQSSHAYRIATAYYVDSAGVSRVTQAVDLTDDAESKAFWTKWYGHEPDLALNLPNAMITVPNDLDELKDVAWSDLPSAEQIRGFYALQPHNPASPATSDVPYASNPTAGDNVRFQVQVHNYSLVDMKQSLQQGAEFWAVPVDSAGDVEPGEPVLIGRSDIPRIPAQGSVSVTSPAWSAVGPTGDDGLQNWRIFVQLDPDNSIDEIHPLTGQPPCPADSISHSYDRNPDAQLVDPMTGKTSTLSCGQNNQGYGTLTVMARSDQLGASLGANSHVKLAGGGLLTPPGSGLGNSHGNAKLVVGQQAQIAIHADASADMSDISHVFVTDGPFSRGKLVADTPLAGADVADGGTATFTYQPSTPGRHVLYERLLRADGTTSEQTLVINVAAHGAPSRLQLKPARATILAGRHQSYTAIGYDRYGNRVGNVTSATKFTIKPHGHCRRHLCTASKAGKYTVIGTDGKATGSASLTVRAAREIG